MAAGWLGLVSVLCLTWGVLGWLWKRQSVHGWATSRGIALGMGYILFRVRSLGAFIYNVGQRWAVVWRRVFMIGTFLVVFLIPITFFALVAMLWVRWTSPAASPVAGLVLPGINTPWSDFWYILVAMAVNTILHEAGHALSAVSQRIHFRQFALFVFVLYPGALIDFGTPLAKLDPPKRLRVATSGVFCNLLIVVVAICGILVLPVLWTPLYQEGMGVSVVDVAGVRALWIGYRGSQAGLVSGMMITHVDRCAISTLQEWQACLENHEPPSTRSLVYSPSHTAPVMVAARGHCISAKDVTALSGDVSMVPCCQPDALGGLRCLLHQQYTDADRFGCVADSIVSLGPAMCWSDDHCGQEEGFHQFCMHRVAPWSSSLSQSGEKEEQEQFFVIHGIEMDPVLLYGVPRSVFTMVSIAPYIPRLPFCRTFSFCVLFPVFLEKLLRFIISLGVGIAVLNLMPVPYLDGSVIVDALLDHWPSGNVAAKRLIGLGSRVLASVVLGLNLLGWIIDLV